MAQIFGEIIEELPQDIDCLELNFTSGSQPIPGRWKNNRLSAHFIADYVANLMSVSEGDADEESISTSKNSVSYIGNELLENATKNNEQIGTKVKLGIFLKGKGEKTTAVIYTENNVNTKKARKYQTFIRELLSTDTDELYVEQIEKTAEDEDGEASGLGLLTIVNDYSATLGWKFEIDASNPQIVIVTTMAQVVV